MFCEEPIISGGEIWELDDKGDMFFDLYHEMALHLTKEYKMILETEHFYILLSVNGVKLLDKTCSADELAKPGEFMPFIGVMPYVEGEDDNHWIGYLHTLFEGERLLSVEKQESYYSLSFDDFEMRLVPYESDKRFPTGLCNKDHGSYNHVLGYDSRLKKCQCGGNGELLLDFVDDYVIRCDKCRQGTYREQMAINAIKAWDDDLLECDFSNITIE